MESAEGSFRFTNSLRLRVAAAQLTHDAFLRCRRDDVAHVQVLGGQFAVQAQEVAETPLDSKVLALEDGEGCLEAQNRGRTSY